MGSSGHAALFLGALKLLPDPLAFWGRDSRFCQLSEV